MNPKIKKKVLLMTILAIFLLMNILIVAVYAYINPIPNPGHGGDNVYIYINGASKSLQQAINDEDFSSKFTGDSSYSGNIVHGHKGEEIIINVGGNIKNLQQSIDDNSLCSVRAGTSPSNFGSITHGNTGNEVLISLPAEKTLQKAINDGDFQNCEYIEVSITIDPDTIRRNGAQVNYMVVFSGFPSGITAADIDLSKGVYTLYEGNKIITGTNPTKVDSPTRVVAWFSVDELMANVPGYGEVLLEFEGSLSTGTFHGEGTITITKFAGN